MPRISAFYGITIWMYWNEGIHARPHFHARYAGQGIGLDGEVIAGSLPRRAVALVAEWAALHREEFLGELGACSPRGAARADRAAALTLSAMEQLVDITGVEVVGGYRLRLAFADGTVGEVDFSDREWHGVFEPLKDPAEFARVEVDPDAGTITWPGGLDMAPEPLYAEARRNRAIPVGR